MKRLIGLNVAVALAAAFAVLGAAEKTEARTRLSLEQVRLSHLKYTKDGLPTSQKKEDTE